MCVHIWFCLDGSVKLPCDRSQDPEATAFLATKTCLRAFTFPCRNPGADPCLLQFGDLILRGASQGSRSVWNLGKTSLFCKTKGARSSGVSALGRLLHKRSGPSRCCFVRGEKVAGRDTQTSSPLEALGFEAKSVFAFSGEVRSKTLVLTLATHCWLLLSVACTLRSLRDMVPTQASYGAASAII